MSVRKTACLGMAMADVSNVVHAVQILRAVCCKEPAATTGNYVQGLGVEEGRVVTNISQSTFQHFRRVSSLRVMKT